MITDPTATAQTAGLHYVSDTTPGIRRQRVGKGFRYLRTDGGVIRDREVLGRVKVLAIPLPGGQSGSAPILKGTCKPPGGMPKAASNTAITHAGGRSAMRLSMTE